MAANNMIFKNGLVYTVDSKRSWGEAIAISGNTIRGVGSNAEIEAFIGPDSKVIDLEGKLVLGFTGFVRSWHRLDRVLRVIAEHPDENWHLFLAGDGPDRPRLEAMARELGVSDRMTVTGIVERDKIPEMVQRFDIALQPDVVAYASPLKMFEYMELAKPILAPDTENIREILVDNCNALLFELTDECFARKLTRLCENPELRQTLGLAARNAVVEQQLYWDSNAERIVAIFKELR